MSNLIRGLRGLALAMTGMAGSFAARAADTMESAYWNLPKGVTDISNEVWHLHMAAFWVCVVIAIVVFGVMFYSIFAHRRSKHPVPATFHHSTTVEIIWTIIPFVILIGLAVPAAGTLIKQYDTRNAEMTVKITGYQWKWQYEYVGEGVSFFSTLDPESNNARQLHSGIDPKTVPHYLHNTDNYLVLPVGKKVRFLLTSNDVIHGWWVPDLAIKKDAIPGYINEMWTQINEPGIYRGQCTVLCGRDHGFMPIVVHAMSAADYAAWLAKQKGGAEVAAAAPVVATDAAVDAPVAPAAAEAAPVEVAASSPAAAAPAAVDAKAGEKLFLGNCAACHQATGAGLPPTFPALTGSKVVAGPIDAQITQVLKGKNAMPPFAQLSDADIAAVVTYTRNNLGNKVGDTASAEQVKKLR
ncbi:MAG: cytochrome c oxidase subunit II [Nevskia sp.]|nr:cytochrome c oxidase subunit II [Nevskia sp.]